ncbi:TetR/AcrR family transcriptional regulator [Cupriavidus sp. AcVe19-1a]|nr:TetR/AcrR family transcriptional regulator [Cupriavidus sp. AcVe19-1a]
MHSSEEGALGAERQDDTTPKTPPSRGAGSTKYRRGLETRQRVIDLTKALIAEHGYGEVTLDQVSAHAGVAKSSLLWHFGSKEMLLAEAAISLFQEIEVQFDPADLQGLTVSQRVDELFERVADYFARNPETKGIVLALLFSGNAPQSVREHIREGWNGHVRVLAEALGTPERPLPPETARALLAVFHGCYCHWYANGRQEDIRSYLAPAREMFRYWYFGAK